MLKREKNTQQDSSSFVKYVTEGFHQILIGRFCNGLGMQHSIQYGTWTSRPDYLHFNKFSLTKKWKAGILQTKGQPSPNMPP